MTNTYIAKRLFEHGPLTRSEFHEITGWERRRADTTLGQLLHTGAIKAGNCWVSRREPRGRYKVRQFFLNGYVGTSDA